MVKTKLSVPLGGPIQAKAGDAFGPSQVEALGMSPPGVKLLVPSSNFAKGGSAGGDGKFIGHQSLLQPSLRTEVYACVKRSFPRDFRASRKLHTDARIRFCRGVSLRRKAFSKCVAVIQEGSVRMRVLPQSPRSGSRNSRAVTNPKEFGHGMKSAHATCESSRPQSRK